MPSFEVLPVEQAQANSTSGKRARLLREYIQYIERVPDGHAGKLEPGEDESTSAVRRRLSSAAKVLGKALDYPQSRQLRLFLDRHGQWAQERSQGHFRTLGHCAWHLSGGVRDYWRRANGLLAAVSQQSTRLICSAGMVLYLSPGVLRCRVQIPHR